MSEKPPVATIEYEGRMYDLVGVTGEDIMIRRFRQTGRFYELDLLEKVAGLGVRGCYLDIGANIGNHSIFFANHCPSEALACVEAHPDIFGALERNVCRHVGKPYKLLNVAVTDSPGFARCSDIDPSNVGGTRVISGRGGIRAVTLGDLLDEIGNVRLVKMDIEGWELPVIRASLEAIDRVHPVLITEFHIKREYKACLKILKKLGYRSSGPYAVTPTFICNFR